MCIHTNIASVNIDNRKEKETGEKVKMRSSEDTKTNMFGYDPLLAQQGRETLCLLFTIYSIILDIYGERRRDIHASDVYV
jgi:hypothetical protein